MMLLSDGFLLLWRRLVKLLNINWRNQIVHQLGCFFMPTWKKVTAFIERD